MHLGFQPAEAALLQDMGMALLPNEGVLADEVLKCDFPGQCSELREGCERPALCVGEGCVRNA